MSNVIVGISDCRVSGNTEDSLVTYALGSCIAIAIHDPVACVGGLLHYMLPESNLHKERSSENPYMFADSGVPLLFREAYKRGADKKRLIVRVAGGAQVMSDGEVFNIGKRNYLALKKILWKAGVMIHAEAVGGSVSRTVRLEVGTGRMLMREAAGAEQELVPPKQHSLASRHALAYPAFAEAGRHAEAAPAGTLKI